MSYFKVICIKDLNEVEEIDSFFYDDALLEWQKAKVSDESKFIIEVYKSSDLNKNGERFDTYEREGFDIP